MGAREKITLCSVGDLMICDSPLYVSVGAGSRYPQIRDRLYRECEAGFDSADIIIGNLETVVYHPKKNSLTELQMACDESAISDLKDAGFSILNIANNHIMQHGTEGFRQTVQAIENAGIHPIGLKGMPSLEIDVKGRHLHVLSLCIHIEWYQPDNILYEDNIEHIAESIRSLRARDKDSIIVLSVHWGDEYAVYPSNAQTELAHILVDLGTDIILGHHSHVFQGIESYNGALIVYGQGNFVSDMNAEVCRQTGIVRIEIDPVDGKRAIHYAVYPCYIGDDFVPVPSGGSWLDDRQAKLEEALSGKYSDGDYWRSIAIQHQRGHGTFRDAFLKNILKYKPAVAARMLRDFSVRKLKRLTGRSSDGSKGSMDREIRRAMDSIARNRRDG